MDEAKPRGYSNPEPVQRQETKREMPVGDANRLSANVTSALIAIKRRGFVKGKEIDLQEIQLLYDLSNLDDLVKALVLSKKRGVVWVHKGAGKFLLESFEPKNAQASDKLLYTPEKIKVISSELRKKIGQNTFLVTDIESYLRCTNDKAAIIASYLIRYGRAHEVKKQNKLGGAKVYRLDPNVAKEDTDKSQKKNE